MKAHRSDIVVAILIVAFLFAAAPIFYSLITGDFPGAHLFYGMQEDDPLPSAIFALRDMMGL